MYQDFVDYIVKDFYDQVHKNEREFEKTIIDYKFQDFNKKVKDLIFKIENFLIRNPQLSGNTVNDVISEADRSKMFKATLLKSVTKQGRSEFLQKSFIEKNTNNQVVLKILPKSGKNSYRINHEGIIMKGLKKNKLKSLDSVISYRNIISFGIQKLTHDFGLGEYTSGGGQDNQQNDAILNGVNMYYGDMPLIIILDGNYYHTPLKDGFTKLELLKMENKNKNVIITDSFHIMEDIDYYLDNVKVNEEENH
jgi:hypothetical protein